MSTVTKIIIICCMVFLARGAGAVDFTAESSIYGWYNGQFFQSWPDHKAQLLREEPLILGTPGGAGNCVEWDASGQIVDAGAPCGTSTGATQDLFETIVGNTGSVTATSPITTISIIGASGVTTAIVGTTLTITVDPYVIGALVRPGHSGGQLAYGGVGASDDLEFYSTSNTTKGSIYLGQDADSGVEVNEVTGETVITGALIIK